jgi:hypothetical protein
MMIVAQDLQLHFGEAQPYTHAAFPSGGPSATVNKHHRKCQTQTHSDILKSKPFRQCPTPTTGRQKTQTIQPNIPECMVFRTFDRFTSTPLPSPRKAKVPGVHQGGGGSACCECAISSTQGIPTRRAAYSFFFSSRGLRRSRSGGARFLRSVARRARTRRWCTAASIE